MVEGRRDRTEDKARGVLQPEDIDAIVKFATAARPLYEIGPHMHEFVRLVVGIAPYIDDVIRLSKHAGDLADHAEGIIADAEDKKWWKGLRRRGKSFVATVASILGAIWAYILISDHWWKGGGHP